jgi:hypothetical protein
MDLERMKQYQEDRKQWEESLKNPWRAPASFSRVLALAFLIMFAFAVGVLVAVAVKSTHF